MKPWKLFPKLRPFRLVGKLLGQRGQSIVEFVLLLFAITSISYGFVLYMNKNLARYWEYSANLIINDKAGGTKAVSFDQ